MNAARAHRPSPCARARLLVTAALDCALLVLACPSSAGAAPAAPTVVADAGAAAPAPLRVAVAGSPPFVLRGAAGAPDGLSIEVWQRAAERLHLAYRFLPAVHVDQALGQVEHGAADVLVGPVSILAERATRVAFTQPYYYSSLAIAAPAGGGLLERTRAFLNRAFVTAAAVFGAILLVVGTLVWLAERRKNPAQFPREPARGIGHGIWTALVTMTTVGYGDHVPITLRGRIVMGAWMLVSMVAASSITAFLATALTVSQIDRARFSSADQLRGRRVSVVRGTVSQRFARAQHARPVPAKDLDAAIALVRKGKAEALVFDEPILRYALEQRPDVDLEISAATYWPQAYGFALPRGAALRDALSVELLRLQESGELDAITNRWL